MTALLWLVQTLLTAAEIIGAYWLAGQVLQERTSGWRKYVLWIGMGLTIALTVYQRTFAMYSRIWLIFSILFCSVVTLICYGRRRNFVCFIYAIYFETLYFLDLFLYIGANVILLKDNFLDSQFQIGIWRIVVFFITRSLMAVFLLLFYRNRAKAIYYAKAGKGLWAIVLAAEHCSLIMCDSVFCLELEANAINSWKTILLFSPMFVILLSLYFLRQKYRFMYEQIRVQNDLYLGQYERIVKESLEKDRIYHDFKNHMLILQKMIGGGENSRAQDYLKELLKTEQIKLEQRLGQSELDYLLQVKIEAACQKGIRVEEKCECDLQLEDRKNLADWCMLLGNLWDNAIEGCERCESDRKISFSVMRTGNMVMVRMENSCLPGMNPGKLKTEKADQGIHGIGLKNLDFAVSRHEGTIERECKNSVFMTQIIMEM